MPKLKTVGEIRAAQANRSITPLNQPKPAQVKYTGRGEELRVTHVWMDSRWMPCDQADRFRVQDRWWEAEADQVDRMYVEVVLETGPQLHIFYDRMKRAWFEQRYHDACGPAPYQEPVLEDGAVG